jgi:hypothetical protein
MSWEWCHSNEAYSFTYDELHKLPHSWLVNIAKRWRDHLVIELPESYLKHSDSQLADWIWEHASSYEHGRNCSNGGHELYLDPDGIYTVDLRKMPDDYTPSE